MFLVLAALAPISSLLGGRGDSIRRRWPEPAPLSAKPVLPFRIDHDEKFNQTTHVQYTYSRGKALNGLWAASNWRYDSGQAERSTPLLWPDRSNNTPCGNIQPLLNGQPAIADGWTPTYPPTTNPVTGASVALPLTADEEFQAGFACNGVRQRHGSLPAVAQPRSLLRT